MNANTTKKRPVRASAVVRIVIWSVVFFLLAGMLTVGLIGRWVHTDLDPGRFFGVIHLGGFTYEDASEYSVGHAEFTDTVTELTVNWLAGDVKVIAAEGEAVTVTENYGGGDSDLRLRWKVEDGELTVQFRKPVWFGDTDGVRKDLTVAIPAAMLEAMDEVDISVVSGNITYTGNADELTLHAVEGDLTVTGDIGELEMDAVDGNVTFRGGVRQGNFDCVDADVTMYLDMAANLDFDQVDGDVELYLSEEIAGFSVELSSLDNEIVTDGFEDVRRDGRTACWGDGSLRIQMSGVSNKLEIKKSTNN